MSGGDNVKFVLVAVVMVGLIGGVAWAAMDRLEAGEDVLPIQPDTDAYTLEWCGGGQPDFYARGHFGSEPQTRGPHNGEIFERSTVWYSWTAQGESFPVISSLEVGNCGVLMPTYPSHMFYTWSYTEDKVNWVGFGSEKYPEGFMKVPNSGWTGWTVAEIGSQVWTVNGYTFDACTNVYHDIKSHFMSCGATEKRPIKDGAIVRVEIWGGNGQLVGGYEDRLLGADELQLRSAIPYIHAVKPRYKVGETAEWDYRVPATTDDAGQPAYFVQILDCNTNAPLTGWDRVPVEGTSGRVRVVVKEAMISIELDRCQNRLRGILWSELIVAAISDASLWSDTVVEAGMGSAPVVKSIKFDKDFYFEGDVITLTWDAEGNLTKFHVTVDINGMIVLDDDVGGTVRQATVSAARAGTAQAQITPYNKCFTGDVKRAYAVISGAPPEICAAYPDLPMCGNEDGIDWIALIIAVIALLLLVLGFFVLVWLFSHYEIDLATGLLVSAVIVLVVTIVFMSLGAFDGFLLKLSGVIV